MKVVVARAACRGREGNGGRGDDCEGKVQGREQSEEHNEEGARVS